VLLQVLAQWYSTNAGPFPIESRHRADSSCHQSFLVPWMTSTRLSVSPSSRSMRCWTDSVPEAPYRIRAKTLSWT